MLLALLTCAFLMCYCNFTFPLYNFRVIFYRIVLFLYHFLFNTIYLILPAYIWHAPFAADV